MNLSLKEEEWNTRPQFEDITNREADVILSWEGIMTRTREDAIDILWKNTFNIDEISDLKEFLNQLKDMGLVGLPNYQNNTMYYIPGNFIKSYKTIGRLGKSVVNSDNDLYSWSTNLAEDLSHEYIVNINNILVNKWKHQTQPIDMNEIFNALEGNPDCIMISWLKEMKCWGMTRKLLVSIDDNIALNFINANGIPYDLPPNSLV